MKINVEIDNRLHESVKELAKKRGLKLAFIFSVIVNQAVSDYIESIEKLEKVKK